LRAITPEPIARHIDWNSLQPDRASLQLEGFRQTHGDLLFRARWTAGADLYLQILAEHQSTVDPWMILRGLAMVQAVWERHRKHHPGARHLPAVLMYLVYHGATPWTAPTSLDEVLVVPDEVREHLAPYLPSFRFLLDDLHVATDQDLAARDIDPYAKLTLVMFKHSRSDDLPEKLVFHDRTISSLLGLDNGDTLLQTLFNYAWGANPRMDTDRLVTALKHILGPETEKKMLTYAQRLRKQGFDRGFDDGMEKGIVQGQRDVLVRLLEQSFGELSRETRGRIASAPAETLDRWLLRVRDARSLEDVLADS